MRHSDDGARRHDGGASAHDRPRWKEADYCGSVSPAAVPQACKFDVLTFAPGQVRRRHDTEGPAKARIRWALRRLRACARPAGSSLSKKQGPKRPRARRCPPGGQPGMARVLAPGARGAGPLSASLRLGPGLESPRGQEASTRDTEPEAPCMPGTAPPATSGPRGIPSPGPSGQGQPSHWHGPCH